MIMITAEQWLTKAYVCIWRRFVACGLTTRQALALDWEHDFSSRFLPSLTRDVYTTNQKFCNGLDGKASFAYA